MKVIEVSAEGEKVTGAKRKAFFDCKNVLKESNKVGRYGDYYWIVT
jgi:hypothetical protein